MKRNELIYISLLGELSDSSSMMALFNNLSRDKYKINYDH